MGEFEPDGEHWRHTVAALESRTWGVAELAEAMKDMPEDLVVPPPDRSGSFHLPVIANDSAGLDYIVRLCEFVKHMQEGGQTYPLRVALASQLHRFGEEGRRVFHQISATDRRYDARETDRKWEDTQTMRPIRCETLVGWGYKCKHLGTKRCNGCGAPTYFADHTYAEIL
jgi:hypothetical protein